MRFGNNLEILTITRTEHDHQKTQMPRTMMWLQHFSRLSWWGLSLCWPSNLGPNLFFVLFWAHFLENELCSRIFLIVNKWRNNLQFNNCVTTRLHQPTRLMHSASHFLSHVCSLIAPFVAFRPCIKPAQSHCNEMLFHEHSGLHHCTLFGLFVLALSWKCHEVSKEAHLCCFETSCVKWQRNKTLAESDQGLANTVLDCCF